jgi:hypothetical protein
MAKFKYVGDPNDGFSGPDFTIQHGITFRKNEVIDVPDKTDAEKANVKKLEGNSHFVDMSDKDEVKAAEDKRKTLEKAEEDRVKALEAQRKADEKDEKERATRAAKAPQGVDDPSTQPRPPGKVTREPVQDAFGGRTVEERTADEDHTRAGKLKG